MKLVIPKVKYDGVLIECKGIVLDSWPVLAISDHKEIIVCFVEEEECNASI